ncbi:hypothetical protein FRC03_006527 [Tulasnella sp. 419]|nr:hypothetical protein FRC03_006527 [Tulasnella sp. 419]
MELSRKKLISKARTAQQVIATTCTVARTIGFLKDVIKKETSAWSNKVESSNEDVVPPNGVSDLSDIPRFVITPPTPPPMHQRSVSAPQKLRDDRLRPPSAKLARRRRSRKRSLSDKADSPTPISATSATDFRTKSEGKEST